MVQQSTIRKVTRSEISACIQQWLRSTSKTAHKKQRLKPALNGKEQQTVQHCSKPSMRGLSEGSVSHVCMHAHTHTKLLLQCMSPLCVETHGHATFRQGLCGDFPCTHPLLLHCGRYLPNNVLPRCFYWGFWSQISSLTANQIGALWYHLINSPAGAGVVLCQLMICGK